MTTVRGSTPPPVLPWAGIVLEVGGRTMDRGNLDRGKKALIGVLSVAVTLALLAPAAWAGDNVDRDSDAFKRGAIAVVVVLLIAAIWFFVFRGKGDDSSASDTVDDL
jgi:hypothetical protein